MKRAEPTETITVVLTPQVRNTFRELLARAASTSADGAAMLADAWETIDPVVESAPEGELAPAGSAGPSDPEGTSPTPEA